MKQLLLLFFLIQTLFSYAQGPWVQKNNVPIRFAEATTFVIGSEGYVFGGVRTLVPNASPEMWAYDATTDTWSQKASFAGTPRWHAAVGVVNGKAYLGTGEGSLSGLPQLKDWWCYDAATNSWSVRTDLPGQTRNGAISFTINNLIYVGGGLPARRDFYAYDPVTDQWTAKAMIPVTICGYAGCFAMGDTGYVAGGVGVRGLSGNLWAYLVSTDQWVARAPLSNAGDARQEMVTLALNGKAYLMGGSNTRAVVLNDMLSYDPAHDLWQAEGVIPRNPCENAFGFAISGRGYIGGGINPTGQIPIDLWQYAPQPTGLPSIFPDRTTLACWPNPTTGSLHISSTTAQSARLYSSTGHLIRVLKLSSETTTVDLSGLPKGIYFVRCEAASQRIVVQ